MAQETRFRAPLVAAAAVVAALALSAGLLAEPRSEALMGRPLAQEILGQAPLPPGAVATTSVIESLSQPPSIVGCSPLWDLHKTFVLKPQVDVRSFVRSHLPAGGKVTESGYSGGPGVPSVTFITVTLASNLRNKAPMILYSSISMGNHSTVLRVDSQVMLPTSRCVTHTPEVAVPNVVRSLIHEAMRTIATFGFVPRRVQTELCIGAVDPNYPHIGTVAKQSPAALGYARPGSTITLFEPTHSNPACV